jgi:hypothetical protein
MRRRLIWLLVLGLGVMTGCGRRETKPPPPPPSAAPRSSSLFRFYFGGTARLAADTNAEPWVSMSELPASQALWLQTLEKLSHAPYQFCQRRIAGTNDWASTFRELISDFVRAESLIEVTGDTNRIAECELAVRLPADRAEFWRTNLLRILETWTGCRGEPLAAGSAGWQLKKHHDPNLFRLVRSGDWTLIGCAQDQLPLQDEYLQRTKRTGRSIAKSDPLLDGVGSGSWLEIFLDCPNLPSLIPALAASDGERMAIRSAVGLSTNQQRSTVSPQSLLKGLPALNVSLRGRDGKLRISGDFAFRDPFSWKLEPWQIPTNLIHDPIISFTAIQGLAPMLRNHQGALGLELLDPLPDQLFVWAGGSLPVQTLTAAPMKDATGFLRSLATQLMSRFNPVLQAHDVGGLVMATNNSGAASLRWTGIPPFVTPFISAEQDSGKDFLLAGIFPNWGGTNPPPVLFQYLATRTNLVYYDWEVTGEHAWAWRACINVFRHFFEKPRLGPDSASIVWINSVSNHLANTVTEVTRSDSNRLAFVRQGPIGLTGLELMALAHWLESTNFPLNGLALPARTNRVTNDK